MKLRLLLLAAGILHLLLLLLLRRGHTKAHGWCSLRTAVHCHRLLLLLLMRLLCKVLRLLR